MKRRLSINEKAKQDRIMLRLKKQGVATSVIARQLGLTPWQVSRRLHQLEKTKR